MMLWQSGVPCLWRICHGVIAYHASSHIKSLSRHKVSSGSEQSGQVAHATLERGHRCTEISNQKAPYAEGIFEIITYKNYQKQAYSDYYLFRSSIIFPSFLNTLFPQSPYRISCFLPSWPFLLTPRRSFKAVRLCPTYTEHNHHRPYACLQNNMPDDIPKSDSRQSAVYTYQSACKEPPGHNFPRKSH